jgi:hypothetical protein
VEDPNAANTSVRLLGLQTAVFAFALVHGLSASFQNSPTFNGYTLCAVDNPSYATVTTEEVNIGIPFGVPNTVLCAYHCTAMTNVGRPCLAFNTIDSRCQFYNRTTNLCFAASTACTHSQVKIATCLACYLHYESMHHRLLS